MANTSSTAPEVGWGTVSPGPSGREGVTAGGGRGIATAGAGDGRIPGDGTLPGQSTDEARARGSGVIWRFTSNTGTGGTGVCRDENGTGPGATEFRKTAQGGPWFAGGTLIETPAGPRPVDGLRPGDLVLTLDDGPQPVLRVGRRRLCLADLMADPGLQPVEIAADALGPGLPDRAVRVSPQHRVLFAGAICELLFGAEEVLVPALQLVGQGRARQLPLPLAHVQVMFDRHQIVQTHGLWSESCQPDEPGPDGLRDPPRNGLSRPCRELAVPGVHAAARMTLRHHETRVLLGS